MLHRVFGRKLSRDTNERKALLRNLASSLVIHGNIQTTLAKAKAVKGEIEKMITVAKKNNKNSQSILNSYFQNQEAVKILRENLVQIFSKRNGGYLRIFHLGARKGDRAQMVRMELIIDSEDINKEEKETPEIKKTKKTVKKAGKKKANENL